MSAPETARLCTCGADVGMRSPCMCPDTIKVITPLSAEPDALGFYARAELADGTEVWLLPRLLGNVALTVGPASRWTGYAAEWMFEDSKVAGIAFAMYCVNPFSPPEGWRRHTSRNAPTVRRRVCAACGRVAEYGDDEAGCAETPPACTHGAAQGSNADA